MFCTGCEQHLPPVEFWSKEHNRHLARCVACRFKAGQEAFEHGLRGHDDLTDRRGPPGLNADEMKERRSEVRVLRNLSARHPVYNNPFHYRIERSNVRRVDKRIADLLAWTFRANPDLGKSSVRGTNLP